MCRINFFISGFALVACLALGSCMKSNTNDPFDQVEQFKKEVAAIDAYLDGQSAVYTKDPSGIRMIVTQLGSGMPALANDNVEVQYKGSLFSNGNVFEESTTEGPLAQYISGWQFALKTLPAGSSATLYIPSYHAYGQNKVNDIPANSTLVFDIKFKKVTHTPIFNQRFTSDTTAINQYVANKQLQVSKDTTGVQYLELEAGTGPAPTWYSSVHVKFGISLLTADTKEVVNYEVEPTEDFPSRVVDFLPGIQLGLLRMKEGGSAKFYIPSGLGYGAINATNETGSLLVPANSNIIISMELVSVN